MGKSLLSKKIQETCLLKGNFLLRSGQTSKEYFDKYRLEAQPSLLDEISSLMCELIPEDTELLAGLEMGGLPLVTALSLKTQIPCRFVRKQAKKYGTKEICEGGSIKGKRLCLIEDVVTTGGQILLSTKELRQRGGLIHTVLCVIHRGESSLELEKEGLKLLPLFTKKDLLS